MSPNKKKETKSSLHLRNKNRERYDLAALIKTNPELAHWVSKNKYGDESVNFSDPKAVKVLNQSILNHYYGIAYWEFPDHHLCPPIPGRADYIHYIADLLGKSNKGKIPKGKNILGLDIGVGATCIYPLLGVSEYDWNFIGVDIATKSISNSEKIIVNNECLNEKITLRLQADKKHIFKGIIKENERIDFTMSNPPFHSSREEAEKGSRRKIKNLTGKKVKSATLNFSGAQNELIYKGGELRFIENMIKESKMFSKNCLWFTTLVSKESNLKSIYASLKNVGAKEVKTITMGTSNKIARIVCWTFWSKRDQEYWSDSRWENRV